MYRLTILFAILLAIILNTKIGAQNPTFLDLLKFPIDPVSVGRGETGVAFAYGLQSLSINPAHINKSQKWEGFYNRQPKDGDTYFMSGAGCRLKDHHYLGISWRRYNFGDHLTTIPGAIVPEYDMALSLTYGQQFSNHLLGGISLKFLRRSIDQSGYEDKSENSWAVDLGINWINLFPALTIKLSGQNELPADDLRKNLNGQGINIGVALLNAGPDIETRVWMRLEESNAIPQQLRLGLAYQIFSSVELGLRGLADFEKELVHTENGDPDPFYQAWVTGWQGKTFKEAIYHVGAELHLKSFISIRYGYRYAPFEEERGIFTYGLGFDLKYFSFHYGKWIDVDRRFFQRRNSHVFGISLGNLGF